MWKKYTSTHETSYMTNPQLTYSTVNIWKNYFKIRKKARLPTLKNLIQHNTESSSHNNEATQRNK